MTKEEVLDFIKEYPLFFLATVEGDMPRVRAMAPFRVDGDGIVFCTGRHKDVCKQMMANPKVEMCFCSAEKETQVRVGGEVEALDDLDLKKAAVEEFDFLKPWIEKEGYEAMVVFRLARGAATVWTKETNFDPKEYVQL